MSDGIKKRITDALDLPEDIVLNLSKVTINGNINVFIENHRGIVEYSSNKVRINTTTGTVAVNGEALLIKSLIADEITLEGKIKSVEFEE